MIRGCVPVALPTTRTHPVFGFFCMTTENGSFAFTLIIYY